MKQNLFASVCTLCLVLLGSAVSAEAQPFTVTPSATQCSAAGGVLTLRVVFAYPGKLPSAIGLQLVLPPGWVHVSTLGPDLPQIAPVTGDTGSLGWAYVAIPENSAEFCVELRYPAGVNAEQVLRAMSIWRPAPPEKPTELRIALAAP